jgi:Reverse transcriptase (RNA-dependent DNA polymerase)
MKKKEQYTAFQTPGGVFKYTNMPFRMNTSPSHFQRSITAMLKDIIGKGVRVYLDNIIVYANDRQTHIHLLDKVISRLNNLNIKGQIKKGLFRKVKLNFRAMS